MKKLLMFTVAASMLTAMGCNTVGPRTIRGARLNYNQAIANSWDEQLLLNLVRLKYRDTPFFLEVGSVSTQYNMNYSISASPGFTTSEGTSRTAAEAASGALSSSASLGANGSLTKGKTTSHGRNLGLDTGISYDETPTVLYTPLQGQQFVTQMLSPIPLEAVMLLSGSGWSIERVLRMCVEKMNGLDNATSASGPTPKLAPPYKDFARVSDILRDLQQDGAAELGIEKRGTATTVQLVIAPEARDRPEVKELRDLLHLDAKPNEFPMVPGRYQSQPLTIAVQSRSLLGVMYFLSEGVEAPPSDVKDGRVTATVLPDGSPFDWSKALGDLLRIRSQDSCPDDAYVRVHYRGKWFYIDDADLNSKSTFGLLSYLFYLQAGDIKALTPALTLPLGR